MQVTIDSSNWHATLDPIAAIAASKLSFSYPERGAVLRDIELTVRAGQRVGIVGPNGAGKTTLFLCLCGLLGATTGEIELFGRSVVPGNFHPEIGLVFQNPDDQLFCPTVREDVAFGPENLQLPLAQVNHLTLEALELTGMAHLAERSPHQLSGGEKCMVAIAAVLAMQPSIILYDEPSANLDLRARRRLIDFLQKSPQTLLLSSHDLELVLETCDRVLLLDRGSIVADGLPSELLSDTRLMAVHGLETPASLQK
ncbi:MAG: ABC transporter ATP-binding protein [Cyanobacteria bacterium J06641_5]